MKNLFVGLLSIFIVQGTSFAQMHDFGKDGLKGLTNDQKDKLSKGEIVFATSDSAKGETKSALIEAAIVFNKSPEMTWKLISKTEDQPKYIKECKEIKVISKTVDKAIEIHTVGALFLKVVYGVIQNYDSNNLCLSWKMDPDYPKNELEALNGYWQLYPYENSKTLARYGSNVSLKNVPEFIEKLFKKTGVKNALISVKKYIDSGGNYHK